MASSQRWLWSQLLGYASYLPYLLHVFASWDTNPRIRKYQSAAARDKQQQQKVETPRRNQYDRFSNFTSSILRFRYPEVSNLRHQIPRESPKRMMTYSMHQLTVISTSKNQYLHLNQLHPATAHAVACKVSQQASQMRMLRNSIIKYHLTQTRYSLSVTTPQQIIFAMNFSDSSQAHFSKRIEDLTQRMTQVLQYKKVL